MYESPLVKDRSKTKSSIIMYVYQRTIFWHKFPGVLCPLVRREVVGSPPDPVTQANKHSSSRAASPTRPAVFSLPKKIQDLSKTHDPRPVYKHHSTTHGLACSFTLLHAPHLSDEWFIDTDWFLI
ncbi:hypothetical protein E2C01_060767 [Portunus trituberculatus]|uniref:Uncharacterized protein n=1 Tax=Portunus trituberculatus TaxID=210409 RepID=A0A5B7HBH1_PORTR|nr:hypothetical protein [Portunus trituberculatus]